MGTPLCSCKQARYLLRWTVFVWQGETRFMQGRIIHGSAGFLNSFGDREHGHVGVAVKVGVAALLGRFIITTEESGTDGVVGDN